MSFEARPRPIAPIVEPSDVLGYQTDITIRLA
jgi:hypothetical protein